MSYVDNYTVRGKYVDNFWGSPTEREMYKVEESLSNLGFKYIPSPDMMSLVDMMAQEKGYKRRD